MNWFYLKLFEFQCDNVGRYLTLVKAGGLRYAGQSELQQK